MRVTFLFKNYIGVKMDFSIIIFLIVNFVQFNVLHALFYLLNVFNVPVNFVTILLMSVCIY